MAAYVLLDISIHNLDTFREYARRVRPLLEKHGARYLVRGGDVEVVEGEWDHRTVVLVEFPSREAAVEFYESEEYAPVLDLRLASSEATLAILDGYEPGAPS